MNKMTRACGLLLLAITAACAAEPAPPEQQPVPSAPKAVRSAPAPKRSDAAPFSPTIRAQLAARGIPVYAGSEPEPTPVALPWIVQGFHPPGVDPMPRVEVNNPTTIPERYAVHLALRLPHSVIKGVDLVYIDQKVPRKDEPSTCSGTLVGNTAVLTAAHCVKHWREIGRNAATKAPVYAQVRTYSITASPRRNGDSKPRGEIAVKKSFWDFSNWPSSSGSYNADHDYAVVRLKRPVPAIPTANLRVATPGGMIIVMAHYPFASRRGYRMYHSEGFIGGVRPGFTNTYAHAASSEPGSSGGGAFEISTDSVVGVNTHQLGEQEEPGQIRTGFPNRLLMLSQDTRDYVATWINAPL